MMSLCGVIVCAVAVGFFKVAALGVDPFQSLMSGLDQLIPVPFGTLYVIVNGVLLVFSLIFNRHNIGIATLINLFLLGYITQFTLETLQGWIPEPGMGLRIAFLIIGIVVICIGSALYMTADLGVSTYDSVAITMAHKWKWGKFQYIRIMTDVICVIAGVAVFLLGGGSWGQVPEIVGIGTIVTAFFMGPLIEFFNVHIARPMLREKDPSEASAHPVPSYDASKKTPVIRCSICTGEQVAGFQDRDSGRFEEIMLIKSPQDLQAFRLKYGIEGELQKIY